MYIYLYACRCGMGMDVCWKLFEWGECVWVHVCMGACVGVNV